jgi:hypothetical protein
MDSKTLWREYAKLPPSAQQQVDAYIAGLVARYADDKSTTPHDLGPIEDDPAIGMWRDREDMADSSAWVRAVREREWTRHRG